MFRKIIFWGVIFFVIASTFSLVVVSQAQPAMAAEYDSCTPGDDCGEGFKCTPNPCRGDDDCSIVGPDPSYDYICCDITWGCVGLEATKTATGLGAEDPREVAAKVINIVLGFLGIIAVILILVGGFMWMTAAGNEDKVGTAKKLMMAGAVGLIIVLAAFGIAKFVVNALVEATK